MTNANGDHRQVRIKETSDALVRVGLLAVLAILCWRVFSPFSNLMMWGLILAVALYPLHQKLAQRMKNRQGRAATVLVLVGLLLLGVPLAMLADSFADHLREVHAKFEAKELRIEPPDPKVEQWPLIGPRVYATWQAASDNLPEFLENNRDKLSEYASRGLGAAKNALAQVMLFLGALIVAGIMMAYAESGSRAIRRIMMALSSPARGPGLQVLCTATIRSVAMGVLGVAFIQGLLLGVGFVLAGVPGAGILALLVMVLGVLQLPALLISLPVIVWVWASGDASTVANVFYTIYLLIAGLADNVLKPLLLGRGVAAPMPVILIGALGGMVVSGMLGLFLGAVLLALGYVIFMDWVNVTLKDQTSGDDDPGGTAADDKDGAPRTATE